MAGLDDLFNDIGELFQPKKKKTVRQESDYQIPRGDAPLILTPKIQGSPTLYDAELPAIPGKATQRRKTREVMRQDLPDIASRSVNPLDFRNNLGADSERLLSLEEEVQRLALNFTANQRKIRDIIRGEYFALDLASKTGNITPEDLNKLKFLHYITFEYYASNLARDPARTYYRSKPSTRNNKFLQDAWFGNVGIKPEHLEYPYIDKRIQAPKFLSGSVLYQNVLKSLSSGNTYKKHGVAFDPSTFFSNGNTTLVVKDAKGLNVQLVYRNWTLYMASYVSPGKGDNTPEGLFMSKDHVVADFVNKDDKGDLMPSAIRLYPGMVRGGRITFDIDDGFRSHGNPISKNLYQYGITGEKISSGCFRTPGIAQMLNYHVTWDDTDTYLLYDPTIKLIPERAIEDGVIPPLVTSSWDVSVDVNSLNIQSISEKNIKTLGNDEMAFMRKFFNISEKDIQGLVKKILEIQSTLKTSLSPGVIDATTLQKIYVEHYFSKSQSGEMSDFAREVDAILGESNEKEPQDEEIIRLRKLVGIKYGSLGITTGNIYARYTAHRFINATKGKGDAFSKEFFYGNSISSKFFEVVTSDAIDAQTQKGWTVLVDRETIQQGKVEYPDLLQDFSNAYGVNEATGENILFLVRYKNGGNVHLVSYIGGKLVSWNKFHDKASSKTIGSLDELANNGHIPYLYYMFLQSKLGGQAYKIVSLL